MHLRMEVDSGVGPTCYDCSHKDVFSDQNRLKKYHILIAFFMCFCKLFENKVNEFYFER